ncbi:hypothetical protein AN958_10475 [Leucoagaricus sp. SymC.cos]|nr:hypothetical protein AN958_10475 [Leucoagaricus sp. SymC.cos]
MTTDDGLAKGLQQTLEEQGFNVRGKRAKCSPVCPWENYDCCMAQMLSRQEDFANQISMLEKVIHDAGHKCIFLPKFHYWGWCKYRYRQASKKTFEDAKKAAHEAFDSCPTDVIRCFINRSWRFMSAYCQGLTGKAAEWAACKQKGHRAVSCSAMMHIEAIVS